jgi:hypothetical protein
MNDSIRTAVTAEDIAAILHKCGYRASIVQQERGTQVQSAAQGLGFFVGLGNAQPEQPGSHLDFSFHCWITIQGELPLGLVGNWNQSMRFARLFRRGQLLVLTMDVLVAGGVTEAYLCAQCELWDRVIHDFIRHINRPAAESHAAPAAAMA